MVNSSVISGDFIRFVNELFYWFIFEFVLLEEKNIIFICVFVKGIRAFFFLWGGG